jgi:hypothetical protein
MVLELLRMEIMLQIPHHSHLLWQKLLPHWLMPLLCWLIIRMEIRVIEAVIMEEKPLMWISLILVHRCFQRQMNC